MTERRDLSLGLLFASLLWSMSSLAQPVESPDTVSRASPAVWERADKVTGPMFDGAKQRAKNQQRLRSDRQAVTVLRGSSAFALGQRLCEQVVPRRSPDTPVLLKPNLGGFDWFKPTKEPGADDGVRGRVTQPEFVRGVIRCLKARGHKQIAVADGWDSSHADFLRLARISGYEQMAREEGVALYALDDDGVFDVQGSQPAKPVAVSGMENSQVPSLLLPKILTEHLERGLFVSLPKLKAHRFAVVSIGIKGMQGVVMTSDAKPAHRQKWRMHREVNKYLAARKKNIPETPSERAEYVAALASFANRIADVVEVAAPDAVLVDAAPAMGGDGFQKLWPQPESYALGGTNLILVDRIGAQLLGLWNSAALAKELGGHQTSPLLTTVAQRFGVNLSAPNVTGDGADLLAKKPVVHYVAMAPFAIHEDDSPPRIPPPLGTPPVAPATPTPEIPTATAMPLGNDTITIDGKGEEAAWNRAPKIRWDTDFAGRASGSFTTVRFLWSKGALYSLWEVEGTNLSVNQSFPVASERKDLYEEDCVEMMLVPNPAEPWHFFEIELGPFGHFFDLEVNKKGPVRENVAWSSGLRIATSRSADGHRAVIEASLSAPELTQLLRPSAQLSMGLFRMEGKSPRQYLSWRPARTPKPNFHVPESFGWLLLSP